MDVGFFVVVLFIVCLVLFFKRVSPCNNSGCPGIPFVDQAGLEPTEISLPLLLKYWD